MRGSSQTGRPSFGCTSEVVTIPPHGTASAPSGLSRLGVLITISGGHICRAVRSCTSPGIRGPALRRSSRPNAASMCFHGLRCWSVSRSCGPCCCWTSPGSGPLEPAPRRRSAVGRGPVPRPGHSASTRPTPRSMGSSTAPRWMATHPARRYSSARMTPYPLSRGRIERWSTHSFAPSCSGRHSSSITTSCNRPNLHCLTRACSCFRAGLRLAAPSPGSHPAGLGGLIGRSFLARFAPSRNAAAR